MRVMGIGVKVTGRKVTVHAAVVSGTWDTPTVHAQNRLNSPSDDLETLLCDLSRGLGTALAGETVEAVILRRADFSRASNKEGPKTRLLVEGALTACARQALENVWLADGKTLAAGCRATSKDELYEYADTVLAGVYSDAAVAALAGLDHYQ